MHSLEWIWIAAAAFGATGVGLVASAAIIVLFERWRAPVRASVDAYRTACLLDHVAAGAPLPTIRTRRSAQAWQQVAVRLSEMLAGVEGEAMGNLAERFGALSPSKRHPMRPSSKREMLKPDIALEELDQMASVRLAADRRSALRLLVARGHPDASNTFIRALDDFDAECRCLGLAGLADLRVSTAADRIADMIDDPSWRVREAARRARQLILAQPSQTSPSGVIQWI